MSCALLPPDQKGGMLLADILRIAEPTLFRDESGSAINMLLIFLIYRAEDRLGELADVITD
jgi:hypothetical protein